MWIMESYHDDGGHWTITDGTIQFDVHALFDGSGRKDLYPDGVIVSRELAKAYAQKIVDVLNNHFGDL